MNISYLVFVVSFCALATDNIFVISIPKCGTHLLTRCIELLTNKTTVYGNKLNKTQLKNLKNNEFIHQHLAYNKENERYLFKNNKNIFFIYRDPRDQIISRAYWILKRAYKHPLCGYQKNCILSFKQIVDILIERTDKFYKHYLPWLKNENIIPIKFENLIGLSGNGDDKLQIKEINTIANKLNIKSHKTIAFSRAYLFGNTGTFRKGEIGDWKKHFSKEQIKRFKKVAGQLLIDLGYEKNFNW